MKRDPQLIEAIELVLRAKKRPVAQVHELRQEVAQQSGVSPTRSELDEHLRIMCEEGRITATLVKANAHTTYTNINLVR